MRRTSVSQGKTNSKSLGRVASVGLITFIQDKYPKKVPVAAVTALTKVYGRGKPLNKDDRVVKRLSGSAA